MSTKTVGVANRARWTSIPVADTALLIVVSPLRVQVEYRQPSADPQEPPRPGQGLQAPGRQALPPLGKAPARAGRRRLRHAPTLVGHSRPRSRQAAPARPAPAAP